MTAPTMRAVVVDAVGGPDTLTQAVVARPAAGEGEVLVRVRAVGVNNVDVLQRRGVVPAPRGGIGGLECVGEVAEVGAGVERFSPGDRVGVLLRSGGYAEFVNAPEGACISLPETLDDVTAATLPEALATSWWNLVHRGRLKAGERLLVHGVSGGVGVLAAQVGRALGADVVGTASASKVDRCRAVCGVDVLDHAGDVAAAVGAGLPGGMDVVLDNQGGPALEANLGLLAPLGRLVVVGTQAGGPGTVDLAAMMRRGVEVSSSSLGMLETSVRSRLCAEVAREVLPLVEAGVVTPVVDTVFPLRDIAAAHRRFDDSAKFGKVVVTL
ncbi:NADPH2:quinone reductase [Prauserella aidingensis]|uniref:zinc-binding dehydrogenase n=1 Tax=Prauserella aidingensis TaxID=387890 RepID=UPI0020A60DB1|nr:zinc-binding dehydrogenase [Prauserella aidingensis]MCP2253763.1 NADPH2:quinone reductase [Prauserella aidingensis]